MGVTVAQKARVAELWAATPQISVRLIGLRMEPPMSKGAVVSIARRLGLPLRGSPIKAPKPKPKPARQVKRGEPTVVARPKLEPRIAAVTTVPPKAPRPPRPLLWSFGCPICARRLFDEGCAARLEAAAV
jgi:hypothetical protein